MKTRRPAIAVIALSTVSDVLPTTTGETLGIHSHPVCRGKVTEIVVPDPSSESMRTSPANCRTLSRTPRRPIPAPLARRILSLSGAIPRPASRTSRRSVPCSRARRTWADLLPECRCTLVRHSWTTRKIVISISRDSRSKLSGICNCTSRPARSSKPSVYQCKAASRPISSNIGGCSR